MCLAVNLFNLRFMERLVFIVEGDCEIKFVNRRIIPYLYSFVKNGSCVQMNAQKVTTNRRLNIGGGNVGFEYFNNEVSRVCAQGLPWITTFFDFFRIPADFPGYTTDSTKINNIEAALEKKINYSRFIPYIQRHEFEALMFAVPDCFNRLILREEQVNQIKEISNSYHNVEDIDGGPMTAPSKRLESIFKYEKRPHSEMILEDVSLDVIMRRAPRFKAWIESLVSLVSSF